MKIYGPVPSWRLGNSLGVDLVEAPQDYSKICSYDCLYCQLGHSGFKTDTPKLIEIGEDDFETLRKKIEETKPDYITFSGEGEPTLNLNLGYVARRIKQMTDIPLAVLTNASLVNDSEVRKGLDYCDLVIAKIDAPKQELFEKVNRPYEGISLADIIEGIKLLNSNVAIQTLLFSYKGLSNADDETIKEMISLYRDINAVKPITIFLGTAYRPTDNKELSSISESRLEEIALTISKETGIEVVYYQGAEPKTISRHLNPDELELELLDLLKRRPCTKEDICTRFGNQDISSILDLLAGKGLIIEKIQNRKKFYFLERGEKA